MKPLHHHVERLAQRWLEAETSTDSQRSQHIIEKAEKHQRKINRWHQRFGFLELLMGKGKP